MKVIVGIDIGGTKCAVTLAAVEDGKIRFLNKVKVATKVHDPHGAIMDFIEMIRSLLTGHSEYKLAAIGISCGGPLDPGNGLILSPPNLSDWDQIDVYTPLREAFGVPVRMQNDADACALAEWKLGAGKGVNNMIFLTFGTGLGAGLILNGRLYSGSTGLAGEVGHIRLADSGPLGYGKHGSFEGFCSGGGIADLGRTLGAKAVRNGIIPSYYNPETPEKVTAAAVFTAAEAGDPTALEALHIIGEYLGRGLAILVDILNPERIVIGSIYARQEKVLRELMLPSLEREALGVSLRTTEVVPAALGEKIGDYAAVSVGMQAIGTADQR